jgi:hypothetical protein
MEQQATEKKVKKAKKDKADRILETAAETETTAVYIEEQQNNEASEVSEAKKLKKEKKRKQREAEEQAVALAAVAAEDNEEEEVEVITKKDKKKKNKSDSSNDKIITSIVASKSSAAAASATVVGDYREHPELIAMTDDEASQVRQEMGMQIHPAEDALRFKPMTKFTQLLPSIENYCPEVVQYFNLKKFVKPSSIQSQCWGPLLEHRDVIGIASTVYIDTHHRLPSIRFLFLY